mmetsp:Transcript_7495/g.19556  ORF Transcript_7495/g.19556 Transcript_7495/m.19556 type:complete len:251 (+) Transcript_7495:1290-2042(+)
MLAQPATAERCPPSPQPRASARAEGARPARVWLAHVHFASARRTVPPPPPSSPAALPPSTSPPPPATRWSTPGGVPPSRASPPPPSHQRAAPPPPPPPTPRRRAVPAQRARRRAAARRRHQPPSRSSVHLLPRHARQPQRELRYVPAAPPSGGAPRQGEARRARAMPRTPRSNASTPHRWRSAHRSRVRERESSPAARVLALASCRGGMLPSPPRAQRVLDIPRRSVVQAWLRGERRGAGVPRRAASSVE